jgi:hypothetical protein
MADDSGLRAKLDGCAAAACHGTGGTAATTWTLDLSGPSVQSALAPLAEAYVTGVNGDYLVDVFDPDCSDMLRKLTFDWGNGQRMPLAAPHWSSNEMDCFRTYLHEMSN